MRRLLVLRPEPGASATLERALDRGFDAFKVPLFIVEPLAWVPPDPSTFDGLLLTSANAVRHAGEKLGYFTQLPVYAVGQATAGAARAAGFDVKEAGNAGVDSLVGSIAPDLKLLHLCGADRRLASPARQRITSIPVYESKAIPAPDLDGAAGAVALVHSPRAGRRFAQLVRVRGSVLVAAISAAAATSLGEGWAALEAAKEPNDDALLALAARLCNISVQK